MEGHIVGDRTEINANLNATEINSDIRQSTVINPDIAVLSYKLPAGSIIAGKYEVIEPLSVSTFEKQTADRLFDKCKSKE